MTTQTHTADAVRILAYVTDTMTGETDKALLTLPKAPACPDFPAGFDPADLPAALVVEDSELPVLLSIHYCDDSGFAVLRCEDYLMSVNFYATYSEDAVADLI